MVGTLLETLGKTAGDDLTVASGRPVTEEESHHQ